MSDKAATRKTAICLVLLLTIVLACSALVGCTVKSVAGTWVYSSSKQDSLGFTYDTKLTLVLKDDKTFKLTGDSVGRLTGHNYGGESISGTYEQSYSISEGITVKLDLDGEYLVLSHDSDTKGKNETLTSSDGITFVKQSKS